MEINPARRQASVNARELSNFRQNGISLPGAGGPSRWRATIGQQWHDHLRKQAQAAPGHAQFEKNLQGTWLEDGWTLTLTGKADQWLEQDGRTTIREIKTITSLLPMEDEELLAHYPAYFAQLQTYLATALHLGEAQPECLVGELVFVSIAEGLVQTVEIPAADLHLYHHQRHLLRNYLAERRADHDRLRTIQFNLPFPIWRTGQQQALRELQERHQRRQPGKPLLFEAPTGYGKTGVALQFALEELRAGSYEKIFCLTGKSTGQNALLQQLAIMQADGSPRYYQLRSREEHAIRSKAHTCDGRHCRQDLQEKWQASGLEPATLFAEGTPTLEQVRRLGAETGICPYEISRALIPRADLLAGDFNYVFSRRHNSLLLEQEGLPMDRVLLLVDEAHNLPERVRDALSGDTTDHHAQVLLAGLVTSKAPAAASVLADNWLDLLQALEPCPELPLDQLYAAEDLLSDLADEILNSPLDWDTFPTEAHETLRELLHLKNLLSSDHLPLLAWCERPGHLRLSCLDASQEIADILAQFGGSLLMSATLSPLDTFAHNCGQPTAELLETVTAEAPWRDDAYRIAIDHRVDTRLKLRAQHHGTTADTIVQMARSSEQPIAAYFPSYQYAQDLRERLRQSAPEISTAIQPRGLPLAEQNEFLQQALGHAQVLLLMMGGSFAEGIDRLGGRVRNAIIVGPALPVADTVQRARMSRLAGSGPEQAYHRICREPAMARIRQAVGRMVRAPGQQATVLFHCRRFAESDYAPLFHPDNTQHIHNGEDLASWISEG